MNIRQSIKNKQVKNLKISVIIILLLLFSFTLLSQSYLTHHYNEMQGLMTPVVYDITQDHLGQLWFATRLGIVMYDGVSWRYHTVSKGPPVISIRKIRADKNGYIWVMPNIENNKLNVFYFNGEHWKKIPTYVIQGNQKSRLSSFELIDHTDNLQLAVGTTNMGVFLWDSLKWTQFSVKEGLTSNIINGLASLNGKLYVATENGLSIIHNNRVENTLNQSLKLPSISIKGIGLEFKERHESSDFTHTRIWLLGENWIGYFYENNSDFVKFSLPTLFFSQEPDVIVSPDYRKGLFISNSFKIYYFNYITKKLDLFTEENGLINRSAFSIFTDFEKNIWISSWNGVSKIASRRFGSFQKIHGLLEDEVSAILEYEPGKFIFGHNIGVTFFDGKNFSPVRFKPNANSGIAIPRVMDIKMDSKKNMWLATGYTGLARIDKNREIEWYPKKKSQQISYDCVWIEKNDDVWVGTREKIFILKDDKLLPLKFASSVNDSFRKICKSSDGNVYLATMTNGLYEYKNNKWSNYRNPDDPKNNSIYAVMEDYKGRILVGTMNGLFTLKDRALKRFMPEKLDLKRPIFFIVEDSQNGLWLGTNNGVVYWNGECSIKYTPREGLIGQETNRAAGIIDSKEVPWFGTDQGVSFYNKEYDDTRLRSIPPKLRLLFLETETKKIPLNDVNKLSLSYKENNVVFHFRGISFYDEKSIRFKHKLNGFDRDWSDEHYPYNQKINYNNIPPGTYRFCLKVKNAIGTWSQEVKSREIVVLKPFYKKWWFYFVIILVVVIILITIQRHFSIRRYSHILEKDVEERTDQLKISEEKYSKLFEGSKDAIYITSPEGKILDINPASWELFGFQSREEMLSIKNVVECYSNPEDRKIFQEELEKNGFVKDYELSLKKKNGEKIRVLITATAVRNKGEEFIAYQGIIRDITETRRIEQQLEQARKMKAIGTLAGGVAHDLNNILAGLISYPELLLMKIPADSPLRKTITAIKKTGEKAAAMVQDLLTLTRRGVGKQEVVNINNVIKDYLNSPEYEKLKNFYPNVRFKTQLYPDLLNIMGSPIHLFKAVMNLVSNASEAIPEKKKGKCAIQTKNIRIDAQINGYESVKKGEYVLLSVLDEGVGISKENISRIFEPFYTKKILGRRGTGLGMGVVWATVKDHKGYFDFESIVGVGTTFKLYFPVTRKPLENKIANKSIEMYKGNEKILVVDDVIEQREVAEEILKKLGYQVKTVSSGEEAVDYLKKESADLILLDMIMDHGMDGLETFQEILKIHPGQKAVIVSGFSKTKKIIDAQRLGAGPFISKPYSIEEIGQAIREELDK